ncbi:hypothetical protein OMR58_11635 [Erwinia sp. INIA-01]|uniref:COG3904 family protein n=1 Tax=Erwinia sp. INIA01 TaxID=2991500 RepID=UPI0022241D95|nr:hypothetical protein [Erwinia sp. INIA01]MCW1875103.1 hypothetical protein [Erwinia sp. INIA01]
MKKFFISLLFLVSCNSSALTLSNWEFQKPGSFCPLMGYGMCLMDVYEGDIVKGDADKIASRIEKLAKIDPSTRTGMIQIQSNGGDVEEAMRIGRLLRKNKIQVLVPMNAHCYSSCVLLLAGGVGRFAVGEIGIHSFYSLSSQKPGADYDREEQLYADTEKSIRAYLSEMRVPGYLMDAMLQVPSSRLEILDLEKLKEYGLFGIDPVFNQYLKANNLIN